MSEWNSKTTEWRSGHEFLERLAAITPRPRINLVLYHGVLAPRARWRPPGSSDPAVGPADCRADPNSVATLDACSLRIAVG